MKPIERFFQKYEYQDDTCCWLWTAATGKLGYGQFRADGKVWQAHRWSYEFYRGVLPTWPRTKELDHLCRNRNCVNPWHLELVTHAENARRGEAGQYGQKTTDADVRAIRARYAAGGITQQELADEYGIARTMVTRYINRTRRGEVV